MDQVSQTVDNRCEIYTQLRLQIYSPVSFFGRYFPQRRVRGFLTWLSALVLAHNKFAMNRVIYMAWGYWYVELLSHG